VLAHAPRQPGSWLTWDVGAPSKVRRFLSGAIPDVSKHNPVETTECCVHVS